MSIETLGGEPFVTMPSADGTVVRLPLRLKRLKPSGSGLYGYHDLEGRGEVRLRHHETAEDVVAKLNRCERLHPYPVTTEHGKSLYGRSANAERMNRQLDDDSWQRRATAFGRPAVVFGALCWALGQNAQASRRAPFQQRDPTRVTDAA